MHAITASGATYGARAAKKMHEAKEHHAGTTRNNIYCSWKIEKGSPIPSQLKEYLPLSLLESINREVLDADTEEDFQKVLRKYINAHNWPRNAFEGHEVPHRATFFEWFYNFYNGIKAKNQQIQSFYSDWSKIH